MSTIEYVDLLTYLRFLKMADERLKSGLGEVVPLGMGSRKANLDLALAARRVLRRRLLATVAGRARCRDR